MIRYRTGLDRHTRRPLRGFDHVRQSVDVILTTLLDERVMRLEFGFDGTRLIGRNMVPPVVLSYYRAVVTAVHRWEPEYRIRSCQVVEASRTGTLGLRTLGTYFPEGRFGNYGIQEDRVADLAFSRVGSGIAA